MLRLTADDFVLLHRIHGLTLGGPGASLQHRQEKRLANNRRRKGGKRRSFEQTDSSPRQDHIEVEGTVANVFANGLFEVQLDEGPTLKAEISGRMRRYRIRVLLGDRVKVSLSPYDLTHGLVTYRFKDGPRRVA